MSAVDLALDWPRFSAPALCAQTDPDAWFPDKGGSVHAAKELCGRCEIREECLSWALEHNEKFGVWGGLTEGERRRLRRERAGAEPRKRVAECGTASGYKAHRKRGEQTCDACLEANRAHNREWQYRSGRRRRPDEAPALLAVVPSLQERGVA